MGVSMGVSYLIGGIMLTTISFWIITIYAMMLIIGLIVQYTIMTVDTACYVAKRKWLDPKVKRNRKKIKKS